MRSAHDLSFETARTPLDGTSAASGDLSELRRSFAALVSDAEARVRAQPEPPQWLAASKTAPDELGRLSEAAARIRHAREAARRQAGEDRHPDLASMPPAELWENLVAHAAREAARVSAQLAHIGLDIGSIAVVREKVDNSRAAKTLRLFFRDGDEVRRPELVIAGLRDGGIRHGWVGRDPEPGSLDLSLELSPQLRRLILRLCDLVAHGYASDAGLALRIPDASAR